MVATNSGRNSGLMLLKITKRLMPMHRKDLATLAGRLAAGWIAKRRRTPQLVTCTHLRDVASGGNI